MYYIIAGLRILLTLVLFLLLVLWFISLVSNIEIIYGLKEIGGLLLVIMVLNYFEGKYAPKNDWKILKEITENVKRDKRVKLNFLGFKWKSIFNY